MAVLSHDKYKGVRLALADNQLILSAHNSEQDEAEECLSVIYTSDPLEIGFNLS